MAVRFRLIGSKANNLPILRPSIKPTVWAVDEEFRIFSVLAFNSMPISYPSFPLQRKVICEP
jgi:hypothetical protein